MAGPGTAADDVAGHAARAGTRLGRVSAFDARRGLGTVTQDDGAAYGFHATAIADGSRRIDEGAVVAFLVVPGNGGGYEARSLVVVPVAFAGKPVPGD